MKNYFTLLINETSRNSLHDESTLFNVFEEDFDTLQELKSFLKDRYGKIPAGKKKIHADTDKGIKEVGFLHSFWNKDVFHNSKAWYQTDWIEVFSQTSERVLI